jgi:hypothetical protein
MNHENMIISFTFVNLIMYSIDYKCVDYYKRLKILQFPFGGDVSIILPMRSSAGTPGGQQSWTG